MTKYLKIACNKSIKNSAVIIQFPSLKLIGKARHIALIYYQQPSESKAKSYWKRSIKNFNFQLAKNGFDKKQIQYEQTQFTKIVKVELSKIIAEKRTL